MAEFDHHSLIRNQIKKHTDEGQRYLQNANASGSEDMYNKAIQEFILAHKNALYLNQDKSSERSCLFNLGAAYIAARSFDRGIDVLKSLEEQARRQHIAGESWGTRNPSYGQICFNIAFAYDEMEQNDVAHSYCEKALHAFSTSDQNKKLLGDVLMMLGKVNYKRGELLQARAAFSRATSVFIEVKQFEDSCTALLAEADLMIANNPKILMSDCVYVLGNCEKQANKVDSSDDQSNIYYKLGLKYSLVGHFSNALKCFENAEKLCSKNDHNLYALVMQNMGAIYNNLNVFVNAIPCHTAAIKWHGELGNRDAQGQCFCNLAYANCKLLDVEEAEMNYRHAEVAFSDCGNKYGQWRVQDGLGGVNMMRDRPCQAIANYQLAIKFQARTMDTNPKVQDALVEKLTMAIAHCLKQNGKMVRVGSGKQLSILDDPDSRPRSAKVAALRPASATAAVRAPSVKKPSPKKLNLKRGRRDPDDDYRPTPVARGLSTLTEWSMSSRRGNSGLDLIVESDHSSSSSESDDDDDDDVQTRRSLQRPVVAMTGRLRPSSRKQSPVAPSTLLVPQDDPVGSHSWAEAPIVSPLVNDQTPVRPTERIQRMFIPEVEVQPIEYPSPRSDASDTDYTGHYKKQIKSVDQSEDDKQDAVMVTGGGRGSKRRDSSSSSSSSSSDDNDRVLVPKSMPRRSPPEKPPRTKPNATYEKPVQESAPSSAAQKSLRFADEPHSSTYDTEHLYATVRSSAITGRNTSPDPMLDATYDVPPISSSSSSSSEAEASPLHSVYSRNHADDIEAGEPEPSADSAAEHKTRSATDTLPAPPQTGDSSTSLHVAGSANKGKNKNTSRMCVVQ